MLTGLAQFLAVKRTQAGGKVRFQLFSFCGGHGASRVQRATEAFRRTATTEGFQIGESYGSVSRTFAPGMENGLCAVEVFGRLPKNGQCMFFHEIAIFFVRLHQLSLIG